MSLILFALTGLVVNMVMRFVKPRLRLVSTTLVMSTGVAGALVGGVVAALIAREGPLLEPHPTALVFSVVGAGVSLLWLDGLAPTKRA
ncbi:MAG: GlsB/YeaQ/YmgE family stress response membrane protein [Myxococcus sp.]|nr:GlsB/YeaQ/YmgE family stress response membrane protein [Myxococcus sp.]